MSILLKSFLHVYPVSSTNKTDRHDKTEILLKVALNTINQTKPDLLREGNPGRFKNIDGTKGLG
jgi:hypothetical protein